MYVYKVGFFLVSSLLVISVAFIFNYRSEIKDLNATIAANEIHIEYLESEKERLRMIGITLLGKVNSLGAAIDEAKIYTWATYEEMGYALENLDY